MVTFKLEHLPGTVKRDQTNYYYNNLLTVSWNKTGTDIKVIESTLRKEGRKLAVVKVLEKKFKGKLDNHGKPYEPKVYLFTSNAPK